MRLDNVTLTGGAQPEVLNQACVSSNYLQILGVEPLLGRSFSAEEDKSEGPNVAMISADLWQRQFGSDSQILGRTMSLDRGVYSIIGVLPPGFAFPVPNVDIWVTRAAVVVGTPSQSQLQRPVWTVLARLK